MKNAHKKSVAFFVFIRYFEVFDYLTSPNYNIQVHAMTAGVVAFSGEVLKLSKFQSTR